MKRLREKTYLRLYTFGTGPISSHENVGVEDCHLAGAGSDEVTVFFTKVIHKPVVFRRPTRPHMPKLADTSERWSGETSLCEAVEEEPVNGDACHQPRYIAVADEAERLE